ncbi:HYR domain-containing protein [Sunxiuqinia sp. A32]|uniref:HYR domain-containing protein n=1 Tax=Sunxiuqinia sp. A32 TaxID=3461496 RepID=UPI0040466BE7
MNRLLLFFVCLIGIVSNAYSANIQSVADGDWTNPAVWDSNPNLPTINDNVAIDDVVTIPDGTTVDVSSLYIASNGKLIVEGTLIIHGNFDMANNYPEIITGSNAMVIIYGTATLSNKVVINLSSYFVVFGDFTRNGSDNQGEIDVSEAHIYVMGEVDSSWDNFTGCNGDYDGTTTTEGDVCDAGGFQDLLDHVTTDDLPSGVYDDLVEANITEVNTLSASSLELCSGSGTVDLIISDAAASVIRWYKDGDVTDGNGTSPFTISETGVYYAIYKSSGAWYKTNELEITVDLTDPEISCPDDINANVTPGTCGAVVTYTAPVGTDNCSATTTLISGLGSGATFPGGVTTEVYEVMDGAGNTAQCSFNITVTGNEAPRLDCPAETVSLQADLNLCTTTYDWETALNIDGCNGYTLSWSRDDGVIQDSEKFNFAVGTTVVDVTVTDSGNGLQTVCEITVFVDENPDNPPAITAPDDVTVYCEDAVPAQLGLSYFETNGLVDDNCGYENSSFSVNDVSVNNPDGSRTITRTYSISDYAGNPVSDNQIITVTNDLEVNTAITILPGCVGELLQITATINGFGSPGYQWQKNDGGGWINFDGESTGDALVFETSSHNENDQFRLEVSEGACTAYSSPLTLVYDDQVAPFFDASLDFNQSICIPNGQASTSVSGIGLTNITQVSDNCTAFEDLVITYEVRGGTEVSSSLTGQNDASAVAFNVGTSTVVYTVTDESSNSETYSFDVVVNNEPSLGSISTDGNSGDDGSGHRPFQGTQHSYSIADEAGFDYSWRVENSLSTDITSSLSVTGQGTADFSVNWGANSMPGSYKVYVVKQSQTSGCNDETYIDITVINSFNPKVQDFGDACHEVTGVTIMDFKVYLEPGTRVATEWLFDWSLYLDGGGTPVQTGSVNVDDTDQSTVSITVDVGDGSEKNYRFEITNGEDSLGNTDNNSTDNQDLVKIFSKPDIGF